MTDYRSLNSAAQAVTSACPHLTANLANAAALLWEYMDDINWAGFYLMEDGKLVLGPFQGKIACTEIEIGSGVCGTAVESRLPQLVENVHEFDGHIACDNASNSELVVPIIHGDEVVGVVDIDSTSFGRFTGEDLEGITEFSKIISANCF